MLLTNCSHDVFASSNPPGLLITCASLQSELHSEAQAYMNYLDEQVELEKAAQSELEKLIDVEVEKQWQKRVKQWQLEREARRRMTVEMVSVRKQQISEKC